MTGTGTDVDPFIIQNVTDLQNIENDLDAYYELEGNIDASATSGWNSVGFLPITAFTGYLDGKGYTISSLTIARSGTNGIALFTEIDNSGSYAVKNLDLTGTISGNWIVGSLVATLTAGNIDNCDVNVAVTGITATIGGFCASNVGGTITNCSSTGNVTSNAVSGGTGVGGFVGTNFSTITSCYATGAVACAGTEDRVGGFVGWAGAGTAISKCYATGAVTGADNYVGGFAGYNLATIDNCYARGAVTGDDRVGGFIGWSYTGTIDDCFSTGVPTGNTNVGGFCGENPSGTITACFWDKETSSETTSDGGSGKTTAEMKIHHYFFQAGWNFSTIWSISAAVNNGYPALYQITSIARRHIWVEGPSLHYFDDYGNERKSLGEPVNVGWPLHSFF